MLCVCVFGFLFFNLFYSFEGGEGEGVEARDEGGLFWERDGWCFILKASNVMTIFLVEHIASSKGFWPSWASTLWSFHIDGSPHNTFPSYINIKKKFRGRCVFHILCVLVLHRKDMIENIDFVHPFAVLIVKFVNGTHKL